jgi:anthranilate synthase component 1
MREAGASATDWATCRAAVADAPAADDALEADLLGDEKERAEHAMLADLERNDLGKVSEVRGRLRASCSLADAIAAVFPGGTITGAPKPRTMALVDDVEATRRGPDTGSLAAVGFDGDATLNIVTRTLVRHRDRPHVGVQLHPASVLTPTGNQLVSNFLDTCATT